MSITLSSRRTFLQATVRGGAALPLLTSLGVATNAIASDLTETENSLCLFEADAAMGADMAAGVRQIGLAYQTVTLDDAAGWSAMLDTLESARGRSLAVLGRPATVFAVRGMLEPTWRVVLEGRHGRQVGSQMRHEFAGLDAPMKQLAGWLDRVRDPAQYAVVLASMTRGEFSADAERKTLDLNSHVWPGSDLVSLLAWPKGVV
ncbi:MAG: hypothetical protein EPO47_00965 [Rugosibacter sp.]|nr:MAG: hypothetical protein EPO60_05465 [Rugosibacter sp.]TBR11861.1 MAG: hypothetical protein EPO47_00965 [Rugosibacter sp.]